MKAGRRGLELRGLKYRYKRKVPERLRPYLGGKTWLLVPLNTGDIRVAMSRQPRAVADCEEAIQRAQAQLDGKLSARAVKLQDLDKRALGWRDDLAGPHNVDNVLDLVVTDRLEEVEKEFGDDTAQRLAKIVFGKSIPIETALNSYLLERPTSAVDQRAKRVAVELLKRRTHLHMVDEVTRRVAGDFVSWLMSNLRYD
jgi:hypothetical protein